MADQSRKVHVLFRSVAKIENNPYPILSCYLMLVCKVFVYSIQNCIHYRVHTISLSDMAKSWADDLEDVGQGEN